MIQQWKDPLVAGVQQFLQRAVQRHRSLPSQRKLHVECECRLGSLCGNRQGTSTARLPITTAAAVSTNGHFFFSTALSHTTLRHVDTVLRGHVLVPTSTKSMWVTTSCGTRLTYAIREEKLSSLVSNYRAVFQQAATKEKVEAVDVFLPGKGCDFRLVLSEEVPVEWPHEKFKEMTPIMTRLRQRKSVRLRALPAFTIELSVVQSVKNHRQFVTRWDTVVKLPRQFPFQEECSVEVEVDLHRLLCAERRSRSGFEDSAVDLLSLINTLIPPKGT